MALGTDESFAAHLLRRTHFHVARSEVDELAALPNREAMLVKVVDNAQAPKLVTNPGLRNMANKSKDRDFTRLLSAELNRLNSPNAGLGDRMLWFWHGMLTTAMNKVDQPGLLWRQHRLLGKHALGNFRQLLIELTLDPAMLFYLDGDGSSAGGESVPNENYARELMELFSMGRVDAAGNSNYSQSDVTAAAKVLAGWYANFPEKGAYNPYRIKTRFDEDSAFVGTVEFLGKSLTLDANVGGPERVASIVDQILAQPVTALFIVRKLFVYFVHDTPTPETLDSLAVTFRNHQYDLMPVLKQLFRLPEFSSPQAMAGRARLPLEWILAMLSALQLTAKAVNFEDFFYAASQVPFDPPNVAGWTIGNRWVSVTQAMARAQVATTVFNLSGKNRLLKLLSGTADPVSEVAKLLSLYGLTSQTRTELTSMLNNDAAKAFDDKLGPVRTVLALALSSPEFALT